MELAVFSSFADEFQKISKVVTPLLAHQQRVVDRIQQEDQPGLLVVHGLGSGKTLTSIAAQDALGQKSQVIAPAALLGNYRKEREKHLKGKSAPAQLMSMQNMATKGIVPDAPVMIVDEAHRARDPSSSTFQTLKGNLAQKRLLLTGSPFYNHPSDIAPLINLAADAKVLPYEKDDFTRRYVSEKVVKPSLAQRAANIFRAEENKVKPGVVPVLYEKNAPELREAFGKWVDYHPGSRENFPTVERRNVEVPMTSKQLGVYDTLMDKAPAWVAAKVKRGLPPSKQESQQLNAFLSAARQAVNTTAPFVPSDTTAEDPKIQRAFENLKSTLDKDPTARGVVYSNYLDAGINPYKRRLDEAKIPYGEFTGQMSPKKRDQLVRDYNEGKLRALLLSSAGGEGLDLKGTRLMQILEPHWNQEKLKQVEGRGARYKSHEGLPEDKRNLLIENYIATRPQGMFTNVANKLIGRKPDQSVDQYLAQMSQSKEDLINQFRGLLPNQQKTAAQKVTEESRELANSWKPRLARELSFTVPGAYFGASMGNLMASGFRPKDRLKAMALTGALGGWVGHGLAGVVPDELQAGKALAREAIKNPQKENALREGAGKLDLAGAALSTAKSIPSHLIPLIPSLTSRRDPLTPVLLGSAIGSEALSAIGDAYRDKYKRMIAVNELENARAYEAVRDEEKLRRMRKQVSRLEEKVEGDGWKKIAPPTLASSLPASTPKSKSGKDW